MCGAHRQAPLRKGGRSLYAGRGQFTAALEVQQQRRLCMSFLHHMAVQRLCKNPFEEKEVVGITNYLDFGLQVCNVFS